MHPLVQDRHDADVAVRQPPPVHETMLVPEVETVDVELCRDRPRRDAVYLDFLECCKEISDVTISLLNAPTRLRPNYLWPSQPKLAQSMADAGKRKFTASVRCLVSVQLIATRSSPRRPKLIHATMAMMVPRNSALVTMVPRPKPPYWIGCDRRSPKEAPKGRVKM